MNWEFSITGWFFILSSQETNTRQHSRAKELEETKVLSAESRLWETRVTIKPSSEGEEINNRDEGRLRHERCQSSRVSVGPRLLVRWHHWARNAKPGERVAWLWHGHRVGCLQLLAFLLALSGGDTRFKQVRLWLWFCFPLFVFSNGLETLPVFA